MSEHKELAETHGFIKDFLSDLKEAIVEPHPETTTSGGLFPNGVNDIYLNLSVGAVKLEVEVSAAVGSRPDGRHIDGGGESKNHHHPMVVSNTSPIDAWVMLKDSALANYTEVPDHEVVDVNIGNSGYKCSCANMSGKLVWVLALEQLVNGATPVPHDGGFWDTDV